MDNDVILQRKIRGHPRTEDNVIRLSQIHDYLMRGMGSAEITRDHPEILPETITLARAFLIAKDPDHYDTLVNTQHPEKSYHILLDENLSHKISPQIHEQYGHVTHTRFEDLSGKPDSQVWQWSHENAIHAILTSDKRNISSRDLTRIAIKDAENILKAEFDESSRSLLLNSRPLVVHIDAIKKNTNRNNIRLFLKHAKAIHEHIENRVSPYIDVLEDAVVTGPTFLEIRRYLDLPEPVAIFENRHNAWTEKWTRMVYANAPHATTLSEFEKQRIRQTIEKSAVICARPEKEIKQYRNAVLTKNADEFSEPEV